MPYLAALTELWCLIVAVDIVTLDLLLWDLSSLNVTCAHVQLINRLTRPVRRAP